MTNLLNHPISRIKAQSERMNSAPAVFDLIGGTWQPTSWSVFYNEITKLGAALIKNGVGIQDKVAILSNNCSRWTIVDFAIQSARAVTVPIYTTNTTKQIAFVADDADCKLIFVGDKELLKAAIEAKESSESITTIVTMFDTDLDNEIIANKNILTWSQFSQGHESCSSEIQARIDDRHLDDMMTLIYTSGTTGNPKGVILNYSNFAAQLSAHDELFTLRETNRSLAFLPLTHVFERSWTLYCLHRGTKVYFLPNPALILREIKNVRPHYLSSVPRFFEKVHAAIDDKVHHSSTPAKWLFNWALEKGRIQHGKGQRSGLRALLSKARFSIADKLVLSQLRKLLGGKIRVMPCGGAKISPDIVDFFNAIGIHVKVGYGLTETTATVTCWATPYASPESVGTPLSNVELKIGNNKEILVRGPMVMKGYYGHEQDTIDSFDSEGFFKTGDAGEFNEAGELIITDRLKELMKTSGGKYIAPQFVETTVGKNFYIEQLMIIADHRQYVSALVVPNFENLANWAKSKKIKFDNHAELIKLPRVIEHYQKSINRMQNDLASFEQIKKFSLLEQPFSIANREITPTMKLRRKVIIERYEDTIESMYN